MIKIQINVKIELIGYNPVNPGKVLSHQQAAPCFCEEVRSLKFLRMVLLIYQHYKLKLKLLVEM